jgi:ribonucleoside-diphosphate reductase alpha chain
VGNLGDDEVSLIGSPELSSVHVTAPIASSNTTATPAPQKLQRVAAVKSESTMDAVNSYAKQMQGDAPACSTCGHITVRSGTCYKCLNCGTQGGCS